MDLIKKLSYNMLQLLSEHGMVPSDFIKISVNSTIYIRRTKQALELYKIACDNNIKIWR